MVSVSMMTSLLYCLTESVILLALWNIFCNMWVPFKKQALVGIFHTTVMLCRSLMIQLMATSGSVSNSVFSELMSDFYFEMWETFSVSAFNLFDMFLFGLIVFIGFRELSATDRLWTALYAYTAEQLLKVVFGLVLPMGTPTLFIMYVPLAVVLPLLAYVARRCRVPHWVQQQTLTLRILCGAIILPFMLITLFAFAATLLEAFRLTGSESVVFLLPYAVILPGIAAIGILAWVIHNDQERARRRHTADRMTDLNRFIDESRQNTHDFNKHIRYLRNAVNVYSEQRDFDGLIKDVNAYCEELLERSEKDEILLHLDDPVLRVLLYGRRAQASAAGIPFILDATPLLPHFPVKNYELVEMVDNLMNNAFDGVDMAQGERFIRVILSCEKETDAAYRHMLCIQNPCSPPNMNELLSGKRYTTKSGAHQGVGLAKVNRLTATTGGKLILGYEDGIFSAKIVYIE